MANIRHCHLYSGVLFFCLAIKYWGRSLRSAGSLLEICWQSARIANDICRKVVRVCTEYRDIKASSLPTIPLQVSFEDLISHLTNNASHLPSRPRRCRRFYSVYDCQCRRDRWMHNGWRILHHRCRLLPWLWAYGSDLEIIDVYVSMSSFLQDLLTHRRGSLTPDGYASTETRN
ncbi:hypothetical protein EV702DRAFT_645470 [Suillus placidus]|uniref:Uncharacterized protein n=1 Tax=Suillus placidus TaxID=48579 RepID=A0A9P7A2P3_9AGAM|nr:hypothetical protein EV702DRAFT_645470 [Suillus placidus]